LAYALPILLFFCKKRKLFVLLMYKENVLKLLLKGLGHERIQYCIWTKGIILSINMNLLYTYVNFNEI
jgi:hypothetical protein